MDEQLVETNVPEQVVIFEIGASVKVEVDLGYKPYMKYLEELKGRPAPFGTREQTKKEIALWGKAQVPATADPGAAAQDLANQLQRLVYQALELEGVSPETDPEAGAFITTTVSAQIGGNEAW